MTNSNRPILILAAIVSLGGFLFGFDAAIISGAGGLVSREFGLSDLEFGLLVGVPSIAAIGGGLAVGPLSDLFGRKRVLLVVALLYALSAALSAMAPDFQTLVMARAIGGIAFASLVLAPLYIAEIAPAEMRGRLVSINQLNIVIGFAVAYFAGYYLMLASQSGAPFVEAIGLADHHWRWMLGVELLPAAIFFCALVGAPESPRWMLIRGQRDKARDVIARLHGKQDTDAEIAEIEASIAESQSRDKTPLHILFRPSVVKLLIIGIVVAVAQQITGINAVYFYAQTIFELAGAGTNAAFAQATSIGVVNIIFTLIAMALIDRVGRKPLLIVGLVGVAISMSIAGFGFRQAYFILTEDRAATLSAEIDREALEPIIGVRIESDVAFRQTLVSHLGEDAALEHRPELTNASININASLVLVGILGFVASFAFSLGPVMWVLLSEIFPNRIRGLAMSAVTFINAGVSAGVQVFFPWQVANLGTGNTFFTYAGFGVIFVLLVIWLVPETKQHSLEDLEAEMAR